MKAPLQYNLNHQMIRQDLVIMCHEALTNEIDVLVNECAL